MKRLALLALILTAWFCIPAHAQFNGCYGFCGTSSSAVVDGSGFSNNKASGAAGGCSQATTFLARTSGLDATHTTAYTNLICGLVTDNIWNNLLGFYICATNTLATCQLNLVSTSFSLIDNVGGNDPTFVADRGFTSSTFNSEQNTQFVASVSGGATFTLNSAHAMVWPNQTTASSNGDFGSLAGGGNVYLFTTTAGSSWQASINNAGNPLTETTATGQGFYLGTRQGASAATQVTYYYNNTVSGNAASASTTLSSANLFAGGVNGNGVGGKQISAASFGGGLSATDAANFYSRVRTYMTAVGN